MTIPGNSSQTSDGAAAVLVASREEASRRGLPVLGTLRAFAVVGVKPDEMGIGPAAAIPEALKMAGEMVILAYLIISLRKPCLVLSI